MKIEKDIKRIKELAAKKEDENWRFRSFLKGVDLSVGELDAIVHRHNDEVSRQIDCGACGNCCKTILPTLSSDDINRLARELDTSTEDFISRYLIPTEHGDEHTFNGTPPVRTPADPIHICRKRISYFDSFKRWITARSVQSSTMSSSDSKMNSGTVSPASGCTTTLRSIWIHSTESGTTRQR